MSRCVKCGKDNAAGGIHTNGDGYGDGKYVGKDYGPFQFFCWDHSDDADRLGDSVDAEIDAAFAGRGWCGFLEAYVGRCQNPKPCTKHQHQKCWKCGQPATKNCSHSSMFVCGVPECPDHQHVHA